MKNNSIKAIAFDVGGVLEMSYNGNNGSKSVHGYVAKKLKVDLDTYFDVIGSVHEKSITGEVSKRKLLDVMAKGFNISLKRIEKLYKKGFRRIFKSNKELYKFAYNLKKKGYKIGILSDQWHLSKDGLIRTRKIRKFDFVVISCDVKSRKPEKEIYQIALRMAKTKPAEMVFIDNRDWNVKSAKKLGIKAVLFKNNKQCFKDLAKLGIDLK